MAGEIKLNSVDFASELGGTITVNNATLASAVDLSNHYASTSEVQGTHTTGSITTGTNSLTVASGTGINVGDYVTGEGIAPGTTVSAVSGTSITLSGTVGITLSSDPVSFYKANKVLSPGLVAGQLCRAWVNFDGNTSPYAIRSAYNVSSVTRTSTGRYDIYFTTNMVDANYCVISDQAYSSGNLAGRFTTAYPIATNYCKVRVVTDAGGDDDADYVAVAIFR